MIRTFLGLTLCSVMGCTSLVPSTVADLRALSPLDADPGALAVALDLPAGQGIAAGTEAITLSAIRSDTGEEVGHRAALLPDADTSGIIAQPGGRVTAYRIAPSDLDALRAVQRRVKAWKEEAPDAVKGSLSVALQGCTLGTGPNPDARASLWIQTEANKPMQPLLRDAPLSKAIDSLGTEPCAPAASKR